MKNTTTKIMTAVITVVGLAGFAAAWEPGPEPADNPFVFPCGCPATFVTAELNCTLIDCAGTCFYECRVWEDSNRP